MQPNYMDYGSVRRRSSYVAAGLAYGLGCAPALSVTYSTAAAAVTARGAI